ncbi:type II secretion system protein [bacterium]|nr:type II secretion system protein [bacterium]
MSTKIFSSKQSAFTRTEGATHRGKPYTPPLNSKAGFTLAEILITLAIIGVVAAMTLPTLISKVNEKVSENSIKVFNAKFIKGLNLTKTAGDLNNTYENTYDFLVNGLSKNLKMAKICDSSHLDECIPYNKIKYEKKDRSEATVNINDLTTASKLGLSDGFEDVAAFVMGDGTPVILSYDKTCEVDTEKLDKSISSCVAGVYDINGSRLPNKFSSDLIAFNNAKIGTSCVAEIGEFCISTQAFDPANILDKLDEVPTYNGSTDYWMAAKNYCASQGGHMPDKSELISIVKKIYNTDYIDENNGTNDLSPDESILTTIGVSLGDELFSSNPQNDEEYIWTIYLGDNRVIWEGGVPAIRTDWDARTICISD